MFTVLYYYFIIFSYQVDDFSDSPHLKKPLDEFVAAHNKIKLVRLKKRSGLIRGRVAGALEAVGDTVTFLDSHVEASDGWAEPILARIAENPRVAVYPVVDVIDMDNFKWYDHSCILRLKAIMYARAENNLD